MNEYSKNVVRRRHIGKNHTTLGPEYFFRTSAPARIFRPRPAVSGGIFGRDLGPEKNIFPAPCGIIHINTIRVKTVLTLIGMDWGGCPIKF